MTWVPRKTVTVWRVNYVVEADQASGFAVGEKLVLCERAEDAIFEVEQQHVMRDAGRRIGARKVTVGRVERLGEAIIAPEMEGGE